MRRKFYPHQCKYIVSVGVEVECGVETEEAYRQLVSIPSRRVGDRCRFCNRRQNDAGFHPLKAGRRRWSRRKLCGCWICFHPLKAGRRPVKALLEGRYHRGFHPLKAGRRLRGHERAAMVLPGFHPLKAGRRLSTTGSL
jgi:hypothetical protein